MTKRKAQPMQAATELTTVMIESPYRLAVLDVPHERGVTDAVKALRKTRERRTINLRDDPLGHMHHKGRADTRLGTAQYNAGRRFQRDYEAAGIGRLRSSGDIREHVDGGGIAQGGPTDRQMQAHAIIARYRALLGEQGYDIVRNVAIDKMTLRQIAQVHFGGVSAASLKYAGWRFRECLSTLAKDMGLSS